MENIYSKKTYLDNIDISGCMTKKGVFYMPTRQKTVIENRAIYYKKGSQTGTGTARLIHTALCNCYDLELLFGNVYTLGDGSTTEPLDKAGDNDITIAASIEYSGAIYQALFGGQTSITLKPGQFVKSDPISLYISKGEQFASRTFCNPSSGKYPFGLGTNNYNEGFIATSDLTGVVTAIAASNTNVYAPIAIVANCDNNLGNVAIVGDSIGAGYNGSWTSTGYAELALKDAGMSYVNIARSGEKAKHFATNQLNVQYRSQMLKYCTSAIVNYAINDINDSSQSIDNIKTNLIKIWTNLANRGIKVFQCTITPNPKTGNTVKSDNDAKRVALNEWIRTCPAPLSGYFEIADLAETSRNSGIWTTNSQGNLLSTDLLHPNDAGHTVLKAGIDVNRLL